MSIHIIYWFTKNPGAVGHEIIIIKIEARLEAVPRDVGQNDAEVKLNDNNDNNNNTNNNNNNTNNSQRVQCPATVGLREMR